MLKINDTIIERVNNFNFLGLIISEDLSWTQHKKTTGKKISRTIGTLNVLKHFLPIRILAVIYNTLIAPLLNYCLLVWGSHADELLLLQKKAIRAVASCHFRAHTEPLFKTLDILKISDLYKLRMLVFYYKAVNGLLPAQAIPQMNLSAGNVRYNFRNPQLLTRRTRHTFARNSFHNNYINIINNADGIVKDKVVSHSKHGFTSYIKTLYINCYSDHCDIYNCYICALVSR